MYNKLQCMTVSAYKPHVIDSYRTSSISSRWVFLFQCLPGCGYNSRAGSILLGIICSLECEHVCTPLRHEVLVVTSNERACLSQDICCGVSCHPSRICSALDHPPCHGVSCVTKLLHLDSHPPRVNSIIVWELFEGGVN